jgi:hypothetical protein
MVAIAACRRAITGEKQLELYNEADIQQMATTEYRNFLTKSAVSSVSKDAEMVRKSGAHCFCLTHFIQKGQLRN